MGQIGRLFFGGVHGCLNCLERLGKKWWEKIGEVTQWFITFMLVNVLWILFRSESIASAKLFIKKMCCLSDFTISEKLYNCFNLPELVFFEKKIPFLDYLPSHIIGFHLWLFIFGTFFIVLNFHNSKEGVFKPTVMRSLLTVVFMIWSVVSFTGISTFLYFDF